MAEVSSIFLLKPGDSAPDFLLPDSVSGAKISLSQACGKNGLLVIFACNHCPFVVHLAGALSKLAKSADFQGVKTIAISSNDIENYPADSPNQMAEFAKNHSWDFPYLFDEDQSVAKKFGAACTPDFFLFDSCQRLFYAGQFDSSRPKNNQPITGHDLSLAIDAMLSGRMPSEAFPPGTARPSTGCSIKWKKTDV